MAPCPFAWQAKTSWRMRSWVGVSVEPMVSAFRPLPGDPIEAPDGPALPAAIETTIPALVSSLEIMSSIPRPAKISGPPRLRFNTWRFKESKTKGSSSVPLPETGTEGLPARKFFLIVSARSIAAMTTEVGVPPPADENTLKAYSLAAGATPIIGTPRVPGRLKSAPSMTELGELNWTEGPVQPALLKKKIAWPAIIEPTQVPWKSFLVLVADFTGSLGRKLSPPITEPARDCTFAGLFATPVSITPTATPWPRSPAFCSTLARMILLLKAKSAGDPGVLPIASERSTT